MARNQEKAQTMLARWLRYREQSERGPVKKRPYLAELCSDLHEAEKWRGQIVKEVTKAVSQIQIASLGEHRIRDLNDHINKLLREKKHWERRIKQLGGMDYTRRGYGKGVEDMSVGGTGGYLYFGAAKDLPGVRELLELNKQDQRKEKRRKTRRQLEDLVDCDYYGLDDDGELFWREQQQEQRARAAFIKAWEAKHKQAAPNKVDRADPELAADGSEARPWKRRRRARSRLQGAAAMLSQAEIESVILKKRKQMLLAKYVQDTPESRQLALHIREEQAAAQLRAEQRADTASQGDEASPGQRASPPDTPVAPEAGAAGPDTAADTANPAKQGVDAED